MSTLSKTSSSIVSGKTSVKEFDRFLELIPESLDLCFVPVGGNEKSPKTLKGHSWKDDLFNETQARTWLEGGRNIGFVGGDSLVALDIDDEARARELLSPTLWDTLTVSTRSGKKHLYFVNGGVVNADVSGVVEIRGEGRYVLAPGSYVDPGDTGGNGRYEVLNDRPPAMIFPDDLPEVLRRPEEGGETEPPALGNPEKPIKNRHGWSLRDIRERDKKLDELLSVVNPEGYPSASEADFAACIKLFYWEFSSGQVKDILRGYRARPKVIDRPKYVDRTVGKAQSRIGTTISDKVDVDTWFPGNIYDEIKTGDEKS